MSKLIHLLIAWLLPLLVLGGTLESLARVDNRLYQWLNGRQRPPHFSELGYYDRYHFYHLYPYTVRNGKRMNNLGFNDYEDYQLAKAPGEIRIIVLGNSIAAGTADEGLAWPVLLREELRRRHPNIPISLMNAALPTSDETAMVDFFQGELLAYQPDIVIFNSRPNQRYLATGCRPLSQRPTLAAARQRSVFIKIFYDFQSGDPRQRLLWQRLRNGLLPRNDPVTQHDLVAYTAVLNRLISLTQEHNLPLILGTMSFRRPSDSPDFALGTDKSLYYAPCLSPVKLLDAFQATNTVLRHLAATNDQVETVDLEQRLNGEDRYFVPRDIMHHTIAGNTAIVEQFLPQIDSQIASLSKK